jgi:phytol kinase
VLAELPYVFLIAGAVMLGLYLANLFYDYGVPQYISRKIGHLAGCVGFLFFPFLFSNFLWPLIITAGFTLLLFYARLFRPKTFRGVGGSGRIEALAEIHFPATGVVLIGILWGIFNQPWLAIVPLSFMGAGDAVTGLIRAKVYGREVKGAWGSLGMFVTCMLLAIFIHPYGIGVIGAAVATAAEKWTPTRKWIDDNLTIPLVSAAVMAALFFGGAQL